MTAIAFGIVVDDTIHFLTKYLKARREGISAPEAVRSTFRIVGHALWTTTAVLCLGFLVFAASGFEISWSLGILVSVTIGFALLADFLLLPAAVDGHRSEKDMIPAYSTGSTILCRRSADCGFAGRTASGRRSLSRRSRPQDRERSL